MIPISAILVSIFSPNKKESCLQDSPPAAGRSCDIFRLRRSAIPEEFLYNRNEVSYYIKKPYLKSPLRYGTRWKYTAEPALQGMEYPAGILSTASAPHTQTRCRLFHDRHIFRRRHCFWRQRLLLRQDSKNVSHCNAVSAYHEVCSLSRSFVVFFVKQFTIFSFSGGSKIGYTDTSRASGSAFRSP